MKSPSQCRRKISFRSLLPLLIVGILLILLLKALNSQLVQERLFGMQSMKGALVPHPSMSKFVIGNLGGMRVRIPRHCAAYVEYNSDPEWGMKQKGPIPERTYDSRLRSFGSDVRLPEMACLENVQMHNDRRQKSLAQDNPWVSIGINAGEIYPTSGAEAADRLAKPVVDSINKPTKFWFNNYELLPQLSYELESYVVTGIDPKTGKLAKESESTNDVFIHRSKSGMVDTFITCSKTYIPGGVASCNMYFGMEPKAQVHINVSFVKSNLKQWANIRQSAIDFLTQFEIHK